MEKMYKVKIKGFADETYSEDIDTILSIVKTFADTKDIVSITETTEGMGTRVSYVPIDCEESKEMDLHERAVELMERINRKYDINNSLSLDDYLCEFGNMLNKEEKNEIQHLINQFNCDSNIIFSNEMEFIDDIAIRLTELNFGDNTYVDCINLEKTKETVFGRVARDFYNEKYDEIETLYINLKKATFNI